MKSCEHRYRSSGEACCLEAGHTGHHLFRCAAPGCTGRLLPASVSPHIGCAVPNGGGDIAISVLPDAGEIVPREPGWTIEEPEPEQMELKPPRWGHLGQQTAAGLRNIEQISANAALTQTKALQVAGEALAADLDSIERWTRYIARYLGRTERPADGVSP